MSQKIKIPTSMSPFVVMVNGVKYEYPAGETVEVPDHIAEIIRQYEEGTCPKPAAPATKLYMVSPDGKTFAVTINNDGELTAAFVKFGAPFTFYLDGKEYTALTGMTWRQWLESEYNASTRCWMCDGEHPKYGVCDDRVGEFSDCAEGVLYDAAFLCTFDSEEDRDNICNETPVLADDEISQDKIYDFVS